MKNIKPIYQIKILLFLLVVFGKTTIGWGQEVNLAPRGEISITYQDKTPAHTVSDLKCIFDGDLSTKYVIKDHLDSDGYPWSGWILIDLKKQYEITGFELIAPPIPYNESAYICLSNEMPNYYGYAESGLDVGAFYDTNKKYGLAEASGTSLTSYKCRYVIIFLDFDKVNNLSSDDVITDLFIYGKELSTPEYFYPFNGNAKEANSTGVDGVVKGATLTTDRFGNANSAYSFDGQSTIELPSTNLIEGTDFTVSFWAKYNMNLTDVTGILHLGTPFNLSFVNYKGSLHPETMDQSGNPSGLCLSAGVPFYNSNGKWYNITLRSSLVDGFINQDLFLNGTIISSDNLDYRDAPSAETTGITNILGKAPTFWDLRNLMYVGSLDDIHIYNKTLTDAEVSQLSSSEGLPEFELGESSERCQGVETKIYATKFQYSGTITFSIDGTDSYNAGNRINSSTGALSYVAGWTGNTPIKLTLVRNGVTMTAIHNALTKPSVTTPAFALGATSSRCKGIDAVSYSAISLNTYSWKTALEYSLDATSLAAKCSINSSGVVTYPFSWTGNVTITAKAYGCNGPQTASHIANTQSVCGGTLVSGKLDNLPIYVATNQTVGVMTGSAIPSEQLEIAGNVKANSFIGDGAALTPPATFESNSRRYVINKEIIGSTSTTEDYYLLLHEMYVSTPISDHFVQGRITGASEGLLIANRKLTVEVNTASANTTNRGSLISYNDVVGRLYSVTYLGKTYFAIRIPSGISLSKFSFTGYATQENLLLVALSSLQSAFPYSGDGTINFNETINFMSNQINIDGALFCKEVEVRPTPWPDFVFEKKYGQENLLNIEKYIQQNGHLPGIPSADSAYQHGVSVAEMQSKLMQKIEELTLLIIDQDKQNSVLSKELDQLKKQAKCNK